MLLCEFELFLDDFFLSENFDDFSFWFSIFLNLSKLLSALEFLEDFTVGVFELSISYNLDFDKIIFLFELLCL